MRQKFAGFWEFDSAGSVKRESLHVAEKGPPGGRATIRTPGRLPKSFLGNCGSFWTTRSRLRTTGSYRRSFLGNCAISVLFGGFGVSQRFPFSGFRGMVGWVDACNVRSFGGGELGRLIRHTSGQLFPFLSSPAHCRRISAGSLGGGVHGFHLSRLRGLGMDADLRFWGSTAGSPSARGRAGACLVCQDFPCTRTVRTGGWPAASCPDLEESGEAKVT